MNHSPAIALGRELSRLLDMAEEGNDITPAESARLNALASALGSSVRISRCQSMDSMAMKV